MDGQTSSPPLASPNKERGWIYRQLGVEPVINCTGVRTNYGGSNPCPEVLDAMVAAAEAFVDLDELAEGVGRRLSELTSAEWGIVTAGTAAALVLVTAACIAGNDPERMLRLPRAEGLPRRVIMPVGHRFDYDNSIRMAGAQIITVSDVNELEAELENETVMVSLLGRLDGRSGISLKEIAPRARRRGIPVVVDAAGLAPSRPDPWLTAGADLVIYSGGKYLRAPQSTGFLLGKERLCRAAWINGAPHQALGRPMKVGKEEIVGAVTAFDRWINAASARAEIASWRPRLERIARPLAALAGVTLRIKEASKGVTVPRLQVMWEEDRIALNSEELRQRLLAMRPRILLHDFWSTTRSITLDPFNLSDGDADTVARALVAILSSPTDEVPDEAEAPAVQLSGKWSLNLQFLSGAVSHELELEQLGSKLTGIHIAKDTTGTVEGLVQGRTVFLAARHALVPMDVFYDFSGLALGESLEGEASLGAATDEHLGPVFRQQFGTAKWTAVPS